MDHIRNTHFNSLYRLVSTILLPLLFCSVAGCKKKEAAAPPPPVVEVVAVVQQDVPFYMEWVASTDGSVNANIRPQVDGYLISQNYTEGDVVRKGQVLFRIDPRVFQTNLDQARGQLAQQEARWATAKANLKRVKPLAAQNAVSQKDLDDATGTEQSTHAAVIAARAEVEKARLNLEFTRVTSLITGVAGIAKAQIGDLVGPNHGAELTTVSTVDPIRVYVPISEQQYLKAMENRKNKADKTELELILADGRTFPHKGKISFADRQIDPKTGTIKVATLFPNPGNLLRPGQFAKVRARMGIERNALLVPQRAVTEMQGKLLVAVVGPDNKVSIRPVETGQRVGSLQVVSKGLQPGEKVVAEGVQKVKDGMPVNPRPFVPPGETGPKSADKKASGTSAPAPAGKR
ncbi:MAG: efflux RND transporter periplasmic adaptor subunit [Geobacteraceae bacterium]|nr:efflux RND transporter periplasmic adaptor subunit [Geobacteraceae bacterium]